MHAFENYLRTARFLIVDEEPVSASAMEISLAAAGHDEVLVISDPREAVQGFRDYKPDIVLLDVAMPQLSGFQILEDLRKQVPPDDHLPFIVITSDPAESVRRKALLAGASDFLPKPFGSTELTARVENLVRTRFLHMGLREQNRLLDKRVTERTQELEAAMEELRETQRQAIREQRLHAFSQMAGGVVHDFNNVLMILMSLTDVLERQVEDTGMQTHVATMQAVLQEGAQLVARLHYFCRPRHDDDLFMPTDLRRVVEEAVNLSRPKWQNTEREGEIRLALEMEKVEPLPCNAMEMREALFHLMLNAVDAMPKGGTLSVTLRNVSGGVELLVGDTGTGMPEEVRARCLDPFYSTKGETGTGLGLAMVQGVVSRHGGEVDVTSKEGEGSTFRILLPQKHATTQAVRGNTTLAISRSLRVLLAEDDERLRELMALQLESMGHTVESAPDGTEALRKFSATPFDLIVTDLSMPRMNGVSLAEAARGIAARIPVIMLTGYGAMLLPDGERPAGVDVLLSKPVTRDNLASAIAQVAA